MMIFIQKILFGEIIFDEENNKIKRDHTYVCNTSTRRYTYMRLYTYVCMYTRFGPGGQSAPSARPATSRISRNLLINGYRSVWPIGI